MKRIAAGMVALAALALPTPGAQAAPQVTELPPPTPVVIPLVPVAPPVFHPVVPQYRQSRYEVWQNYGVDRQGRFRPRVVYLPGGAAYYYSNGQPYPWFDTHPRAIMPRVSD